MLLRQVTRSHLARIPLRSTASSWPRATRDLGHDLRHRLRLLPRHGGDSGTSYETPKLLTFVGGISFFAAAGKGSACQLGSAKPSLAGPALDQYASEKQALLAGNYLTSKTCSDFFNAKGRSNYVSRLTSAVTNQTPYDGP